MNKGKSTIQIRQIRSSSKDFYDKAIKISIFALLKLASSHVLQWLRWHIRMQKENIYNIVCQVSRGILQEVVNQHRNLTKIPET